MVNILKEIERNIMERKTSFTLSNIDSFYARDVFSTVRVCLKSSQRKVDFLVYCPEYSPLLNITIKIRYHEKEKPQYRSRGIMGGPHVDHSKRLDKLSLPCDLLWKAYLQSPYI